MNTLPELLRFVLCFLALLVASSSLLAASNPVPFVEQPLLPAATAPGGPGFILTVNGLGFVSGAVVQWNGSARATTFVSATQLTASILASDTATAATAQVSVVNPTPGGGTSNIVGFPVTQPTAIVTFPSSPEQVTLTTGSDTISEYGVPNQPLTADFNGDGKADLVVVTTSRNLSVSLATGGGNFAPPVYYSYDPNNISSGGFYGIAVGDFNGDGKLDIVVSYSVAVAQSPFYQNGTAVLFGNGDGTFQTPVASVQNLGYGIILYNLQAIDLNQDGKLDLVGACGGICSLLANGDGTFRAGSAASLPNNHTAVSVAVGDFNGDGFPDVAATVGPQYVILALGNGDGSFQPYQQILNTYSLSPGGIAAGDFNGDGKLDLAFYHDECALQQTPTCGQLDILPGNGDGTFQSPVSLTGLAQPQAVYAPVVADFNGDGHVDLLFGGYLLLLGTSPGQPFSYNLLTLPSDPGQQNQAGDFYGNGRLAFAGVARPTPGVGLPQNFVNLFAQTPPPGDFKGSSTPSYRTVVTGNSTTFTIQVSGIDGFSGVITPTISGLPSGVTASFNPLTITGSGSTVLTLNTTSSAPTGSYPPTITLTSGSLAHAGGITLNVGPSGTNFGDFTGTFSSTYANVVAGTAAPFGITVQPLYGFTGNVSLTVSGLPAGSAYSFSNPLITGGSGSTNLVITPSASTSEGTYQFTVTATSGAIVHSNVLALIVGPTGTYDGDFTGSITPASQTVAVGGAASYTLTWLPLYGFDTGTDIITLTTIGLPSGVVASGNPTPAPNVPDTITLTTSASTAPGTYSIVIYAHGGVHRTLSHSQTITLTVTP